MTTALTRRLHRLGAIHVSTLCLQSSQTVSIVDLNDVGGLLGTRSLRKGQARRRSGSDPSHRAEINRRPKKEFGTLPAKALEIGTD